MNKFNKVDYDTPPQAWGSPYTGGGLATLTTVELRMRKAIQDGSLSRVRARRVFESLDPNTPFLSPFDYIEALAALTALFWDEVNRKTTQQGKSLARVLYQAAGDDRVQWLFNNIRFRRVLDPRKLSLLGSGTSPNEALHAEINRWFRNNPEFYATTLGLQLKINTTGKLMAHNSALYQATLRQLPHATVLGAAACAFTIRDDSWGEWCAHLQVQDRSIPERAPLPLHQKRIATTAIIAQHSTATLRRPSAAPLRRKRTPFTLKRKRSGQNAEGRSANQYSGTSGNCK
jgi:hypothetical protein